MFSTIRISLLVAVIASSLTIANGATVALTSATLSGNDLQSATLVGGRVIGSSEISAVASVTPQNSSATFDIFWKQGDTEPDNTTLDSVLLGLDVTTGVLNPQSTGTGFINFSFSSTISDGIMIFNPDTTPDAESWTVRALDGSSTVIGNSVAFGEADMGDTGNEFTFDRNSAGPFTQDIYGIYIPISDFGVSSLEGIRISTSDGDPSLLVGVIPEASTLAYLVVLIPLALISRRFIRQRR